MNGKLMSHLVGLFFTLTLIGCSDAQQPQSNPMEESGEGESSDVGAETNDGTDEPATTISETFVCRYDNAFSGFAECKEYRGGWERAEVDEDCGEVFSGVSGTLTAEFCDQESALGTCTVDVSEGITSVTFYYGGDLGVTESMCGSFLGGVWEGTGNDEESAVVEDDFTYALSEMLSNDEVTVTPECTDDTCVDALSDAEEGIWFRPTQTTSTTGIVFYPGGAVDPRAYAPAAQILAKQGFTVVIVPMPGGFAFSAFDRVNVIIESDPSVTSWFLGGHSAGGAAAIMYAARSENVQIDGMFLLAAYGSPSDDLSASDLPIVSLFGTNDGLTTLDEIEQSKLTLPSETLFIELQGANHAQFGYYGDQERDLSADIGQAEQHQLYTSAIAHFVQSTQQEQSPEIHPGFEAAREIGLDWCKTAQKLIGGLEDESKVNVSVAANLMLFSESKPALLEGNVIDVQAFSSDFGNPTILDAPSVLMGETWCKMKEKAALPSELVVNTSTTCREVNQAALDWAVSQLNEQERAAYESSSLVINFAEDQVLETGFEWLQASAVDLNGTTLRASRFSIGLNREDVPAESRGVSYCKTWSPARALLWVLGAE